MSTQRRLSIARQDNGPRPRGTCRWCRVEVRPPRQTFCSDACVHEWRLRSDPQYLRAVVFGRDQGICAICSRDCVATRAAYRAWAGATFKTTWPIGGMTLPWLQFHGVPRGRVSGDWWDADHITPVVEGGGLCGIDNIRTLCIPCHRVVTRELHERRAVARREATEDRQLDMYVQAATP